MLRTLVILIVIETIRKTKPRRNLIGGMYSMHKIYEMCTKFGQKNEKRITWKV
jgi:hypothetical protein